MPRRGRPCREAGPVTHRVEVGLSGAEFWRLRAVADVTGRPMADALRFYAFCMIDDLVEAGERFGWFTTRSVLPNAAQRRRAAVVAGRKSTAVLLQQLKHPRADSHEARRRTRQRSASHEARGGRG